MGAGASTSSAVDAGVQQAMVGAVTKAMTSSPAHTNGDSYGHKMKTFKEKLRPVMLAQKTLKSFAVKNHARENMSYIKGESVMGSFAIKPAHSTAAMSMRKISLTQSTSNGNIVHMKSDTPPKPRGMNGGLKLNLGLKLMLTDDESDWIQVSEDEDDPLSPRRKKLELPSAKPPMLESKQSLMFTQSGTIFVDGFSEGIGKDGIHNNDNGSHFLITERIVLVCNLGQDASGTVYKALDLQGMRLVAVKCISVFERGKRRQMVRELGALFDMLHSTEFSPRPATASPRQEGTSKTARSQSKTVEFSDIIRRTSITPDEAAKKELKNPKEHIVDFYDAFSNLEDGGVALMMEYMDGGSLQDIADTGGVDDEGTLASIAFQVLSGLHFLHQCNQIHRDIKPANILINHDGVVKVSDLGILKKIDPIERPSGKSHPPKLLPTIPSMDAPPSPISSMADKSDRSIVPTGNSSKYDIITDPIHEASPECDDLKEEDENELPLGTAATVDTANSSGHRLSIDDGEMYRANTFVGTVTYMAPERIDSRPYTFNSDVWSFGLTLLTVALGRLPIDNANGFWSVLNAIRDQPPPVLPDDGRWSAELRDFIAQCLTRSPSKRPSCAELLQHPFVQRAKPDNFEEDPVVVEERGKKEVRAIIKALHTHLVNLGDDYKKMKSGKSEARSEAPSPTFNNHVLAQAIDSQGVDEVLRLLVFGRDPTIRQDIMKEGNISHRLSSLAKQLHIPLRMILLEAKNACREILMSRDNSQDSTSIDGMMGIHTPSRDAAIKALEDEVLSPPLDMLVSATPKARHDSHHHVGGGSTTRPTPKARHDHNI